ncbi:MAG: hypothetical protein QOF20_2300 [Acidimicrobiaceae bacterium]|nr:hypothetical protein [Acidimicrobiaceae bacterium]MDQ1366520.1 hypothetical protein [Acidimicrobiaceae bacterium]MDQ1369947.1 hypothetical protein [Acidimicrobiaceae bacterium]MDQ1398430.1 hypothetical protein [Acidimicrobiaceae bacterium]MDQ1413573.1 hypothetical protein [Acidimicrobiaceae bacterium]
MRNLGTLFVLRLLLVSNALVMTAVGGIALAFVERPAGVIIAAGCWVLACVLLCLLPLTDPYRRPRRRASTEGQ